MTAATRGALALTIYVVWLLLAFGVRTVVHYRRTGSSGFKGLSGRPGSAEWVGGILFVAALLAGASSTFLQMADALRPLRALRTDLAAWSGVVLAGVGVMATYLAQVAMGSSWRIGVDRNERTALVTRGVFSLVRNPIFSAMLVTSSGMAILVGNVLAIGALLALFVAVELQVRKVEEPYLLQVHGDAYRRYAARTGRFLPGIGRLPA